MIRKLKEKLTGFSRCAGIEAILSEDIVRYHFVLLEKKGNLINVLERAENLQDLESIKSKLKKDIPIALVLNGKGVMHRKVSEQGEDKELLGQVLPNAKESDFYLQKYFSGTDGFISIIRKNAADTFVEEIVAFGLSIVQMSLGPFAAGILFPFLETPYEKLDTGIYTLSIQNGKLTDFSQQSEQSQKTYKIGNDQLSSNLLIAYASAFQFFFLAEESIQVVSEKTQSASKEFFARKKFMLVGKTILVSFIVMALINYLVFSQYKEENNRLQESTGQYQRLIIQVNELQQKIGEKEYFLKKAGWLASPKASFYSDEIASTVPSYVRLNALKINPINERLSKKERKQLFQADTICIVGNCSDPSELNPWLKELKSKSWVNSLSAVDYKFDHKKRSGNFELEIRVKNEF